MNIENRSAYVAGVSASAASEKVAGVTEHSEASSSGAASLRPDSATVSQAAQLAGEAMRLTDVRQEKVSEVQNALVNGTYEVPASAVAESILQNMMRGEK